MTKMKYFLIIFYCVGIPGVVLGSSDSIDEFAKSLILSEEGISESVFKRQSFQIGDEFSYFELNIFAQPEHVKFDRLYDSRGELRVEDIILIVTRYWPDGFSADNLVWLRTAPLYRPPDTVYRGVWLRFSVPAFSEFPFEMDRIKDINFGTFEGGTPLDLSVSPSMME